MQPKAMVQFCSDFLKLSLLTGLALIRKAKGSTSCESELLLQPVETVHEDNMLGIAKRTATSRRRE